MIIPIPTLMPSSHDDGQGVTGRDIALIWCVTWIVMMCLCWGAWTLLSWAYPTGAFPADVTLAEVIQSQAEWLWQLLHRIW